MKMKTEIEIGKGVTILNKYGDEIAEGRVVEVERDGFTLDTGESIVFRHVTGFDGENVRLSVAS